jgi:hypothetical protein
MRFLELGPVPVLKEAYPAETVYVATGVDPVAAPDAAAFGFSLGNIRRVRSLLQDPSFDAIFVVYQSSDSAAAGALIRLIANRRVVRRGVPAVRILGNRMLRFGSIAPIVVFDPADVPFVPRHAMWLWRRAAAVFKRELPLDRWHLFMRTAHRDLPTPRFRRLARYRTLLDKARPMSLGLSAATERAMPAEVPPKTVDLFFAGGVDANSWLRETGRRELAGLGDRGGAIDIAEERLSQTDFFRRCGRARLVWSPAGLGHDTFRHYEAAACGSVPLISRPTIEQYAPFREGETAFFYDPEPGGLSAAVARALERREDLPAMGRAARAHVLAHHTVRARVDHMLAAVTVARPG